MNHSKEIFSLTTYQHSVPFIVSVVVIAAGEAGESSQGSTHSSCLSHSGVGEAVRSFYTFTMGITKLRGKSLGSLTRLSCFSFLKILLMLKAKNAEGWWVEYNMEIVMQSGV